MKLFVVRHGQSVANISSMHSGWGTFPLTEVGRQEAQATAAALQGIEFSRIFVSDLVRTQETARILRPTEIARFELRSDVREYDMGPFVGVLVSEMYERFGEPYLRMKAMQDYGDLGCETPEHFVERVEGFIAEAKQLEGNVLLVTHEGVGKCIEEIVVGTPFRAAKLKTVNCGVTVLEYFPEADKWKVQCWNWTPDLSRFR